MNIEEVSDILNTFGLLGLLAPEHIFIVDEAIEHEGTRFRGLAPKAKRGVMVLSRDADTSTVPHEWSHAMFGVGERVAYPFGSIMALRYRVRQKLNVLKRDRGVSYRRGDVPPKYQGRTEHYVLEE